MAMPEGEALVITEEVLALALQCREELQECRHELAEINAGLGRIADANAVADAKLAKMEGDLSRIRRHLDALPDDVIRGLLR